MISASRASSSAYCGDTEPAGRLPLVTSTLAMEADAMDEARKPVNFTVVPEEGTSEPRIYSNFCSIQNSPFDFTLTFCEMHPLSEGEVQKAQSSGVVKAPIKARLVDPAQMIPGLIAALQENCRLYQESFGPARGPLH